MSRVKFKQDELYRYINFADTVTRLKKENIPFSFDGELKVRGEWVRFGEYIKIPRYYEANRPTSLEGAIGFLLENRWPFKYVGVPNRLDIQFMRNETQTFSYYVGHVLLKSMDDTMTFTTAKDFEENYDPE